MSCCSNLRLNVLIGCERSGKVRDAFIRSGCNAWSCDLVEQEGKGPHIVGDVLNWLDHTPDGEQWDILIAHPNCKYLTVSGFHWTVRGLRDPQLTEDAIRFAEKLWDAPIPKIAIENPISILSTRSKLGRPTQIIQPYEFGDDASKKTCLWLKGLPKLVKDPKLRIAGRKVEWPKDSGKIVERWSNQTDSGQNRLGPSEDRWMLRSRTYDGIANAMAKSWSDLSKVIAKELFHETNENVRWVIKLRKFGASNFEIASALGIPTDSPLLQK